MAKTGLFTLVETEFEDPDLAPEILPVDARLSIKGPTEKIRMLFERASSVSAISAEKEVLHGTSLAQLEGILGNSDAVPHARIIATDGEQTISVVVDGITVLMAGDVLLPARKVLDCLKLAPEATVKIEVIGSTANITSGRAQWHVQAVVNSSLPPLASVEGIEMHSVPRQGFLSALKVVRKAVSAAHRPALMQCSIEQGHISSSDGNRMLRQTIPGLPKDLVLTIPVKVMDELIRALGKTQDDYFELGADPRYLVFTFGDDSLIAKRLILSFPNIESMLLEPAFSNQNTLRVDREELLKVIERVRVNADPDYAAIWMALIPGMKDSTGHVPFSLAVRAKDPQRNTAQEIMECEYIGPAKPKEICVNHHFLTDLLDSYGEEEIFFKLGVDTKSTRMPLFVEDSTVGFSGVIAQLRAEFMK